MSRIAVELYKYGMIKIGEFKLASGLNSPFYIDMRRLYSYPDLVKRIVHELVLRVTLEDFEVLAGVESAGIPLAAYIACYTGKPMAYVRKEKKNHGTGHVVEGVVEGKRVAIVDDVATTGSSLLKAAQNLREVGAIPVKAIVIVDREQGAKRALREQGIELFALVTARELFKELYSEGVISERDYAKILSYLDEFKDE